jgi:hypothetical protein
MGIFSKAILALVIPLISLVLRSIGLGDAATNQIIDYATPVLTAGAVWAVANR